MKLREWLRKECEGEVVGMERGNEGGKGRKEKGERDGKRERSPG